MPGQLTLFDLASSPVDVADVAGMLLAGGAVVTRDGAVRLSVLVPAGWRAEAVAAALTDRGLTAEVVDAGEDRRSVRTGFDPRLLPVAQSWTRGARLQMPAGWTLTGPRARCWALAGGRADPVGFVLGLGTADPQLWEPAGAALAATGLAGAFLAARAGGPAYRVVGIRRLGRLAELIGPAPPDCPPQDWVAPGRGG